MTMSGVRASAAIVIVVAAFLPAAPASAEINYPWCVITSGRDGGVMSCGFISYAQCMMTRLGTESCVQNPRYPGPVQFGPAPPRETVTRAPR